MERRIVPHIITEQQNMVTVTPDMTVREAVKVMTERHIGAVLVTEGTKLAGIFTERDVMARVVSADLDPGKTRLSDVMTTSPDTVAPSDSAYRALSMMNEHGYRHLPILDGETIVGIVSVRDLFRAVQRELEEGIQEREAFIAGSGYGAG